MRTVFVFLFVTYCSFCYAQDDALVLQIDARCKDLATSMSKLPAKTVTDYKESEGLGDVTGYYKGGKVQVMIAAYSNKQTKVQTEYYFDRDSLIFVYREDSFFAAGALQGKDVITVWYFHDGKLIRWIENDKEIEPGSKEFLKSEMDVPKEARRLIKLLK